MTVLRSHGGREGGGRREGKGNEGRNRGTIMGAKYNDIMSIPDMVITDRAAGRGGAGRSANARRTLSAIFLPSKHLNTTNDTRLHAENRHDSLAVLSPTMLGKCLYVCMYWNTVRNVGILLETVNPISEAARASLSAHHAVFVRLARAAGHLG